MRGLNSRARRDDTRLLVDACCASSVVCLRETNKLEVAGLQMARSWSLLPAGAVSSPMQHASAAYGHASRACFCFASKFLYLIALLYCVAILPARKACRIQTLSL